MCIASQIYPNNKENIVYLFFNILMISYKWSNTISSSLVIWMILENLKGITTVEKNLPWGSHPCLFMVWMKYFLLNRYLSSILTICPHSFVMFLRSESDHVIILANFFYGSSWLSGKKLKFLVRYSIHVQIPAQVSSFQLAHFFTFISEFQNTGLYSRSSIIHLY